jgi:hypothetical protein
VKRTRLFHLIEGYLEGGLGGAERDELASAVTADSAVRRIFVEQVRLARTLRAATRERAPGEVWARIEPLMAPGDGQRRRRTADAVDALIDRGARGRRPARGRSRRVLAFGLAGMALAAAAGVALWLRGGAGVVDGGPPRAPVATESPPPASAPIAEDPGSAPIPGGEQVAPGPSPAGESPATSPPPRASGAPVAEGAPAPSPPATGGTGRWRPESSPTEIAASEGPAFAARTDILYYGAFEGAASLPRPFLGKLRPEVVGFAPGLSGNGLRVQFRQGAFGPQEGGTRFVMRAAALKNEAPAARPAPRDDLYLRYYVRPGADFDFGGGGVLPGLCGGLCKQPHGSDGRVSWSVRPRWAKTGELMFDQLPGTLPKERRWRRALRAGVWQAIEMRVRLNTPGASDGLVEGWLDGQKVASIARISLREVPTLHVDGAAFDAFFHGAKAAPRRNVEATFDNMVVSSQYVGPVATPPP